MSRPDQGDSRVKGTGDGRRVNRLEEIAKCMDTLEYIRRHYGWTEEALNKKGHCKWGIELGECDTLEELHRLLYECG